MRILEDGRSTGHRLGVGEITLAPHTEGPPQHRHARHDEGFYVVAGTVHFTVSEKTYEAGAGMLSQPMFTQPRPRQLMLSQPSPAPRETP
jgi:quercetin dioxygenase-like cupin family protein